MATNDCDIDPRSIRGNGSVTASSSRTGGNRPVPLWTATANPTWGLPSSSFEPPGYTWSFTWDTPAFDLRPQLESATGNTKQGAPIWDTAARLYLLLTGPNATSFDGRNLTVIATDYAQLFNANVVGGANASPGSSPAPNLIPIQRRNLSALFYPTSSTTNGLGNVLVGFEPPGTLLGGGEGYPARYWKLRFQFSFFVSEEEPLPPNPTPPISIIINAATY